MNQSDTPDDHGLLSVVQQSAACILVVGIHGLRNLVDRKIILVQSQGIDFDVVLFDQTPERDDVCHARYLQKTRFDNPVFQLSQAHGIAVVAFQSIAVEFANWGREWAQCWCDPIRKSGFPKLLQHDLPGKIIVRAVGKGQLHYRQTKDGSGTSGDHTGSAVECSLNRYSNLLLDFFSGVPGKESDHDDLGVGNVGVSLNLEFIEVPHADSDQSQTSQHG